MDNISFFFHFQGPCSLVPGTLGQIQGQLIIKLELQIVHYFCVYTFPVLHHIYLSMYPCICPSVIPTSNIHTQSKLCAIASLCLCSVL